MTRRRTSLSSYHGLFLLATAMLLVAPLGCQQSAPTAESAAKSSEAADKDSPSAATLLKDLVAKYHDLKDYEDAGELHLKVEARDGQQQESPPIPFSVAFERPNKIRIHSLQASIVAEGGQLRASVDALENQVLAKACPEPLTANALFPEA